MAKSHWTISEINKNKEILIVNPVKSNFYERLYDNNDESLLTIQMTVCCYYVYDYYYAFNYDYHYNYHYCYNYSHHYDYHYNYNSYYNYNYHCHYNNH